MGCFGVCFRLRARSRSHTRQPWAPRATTLVTHRDSRSSYTPTVTHSQPQGSAQRYVFCCFGVGSSSQGWGSCRLVHQPALGSSSQGWGNCRVVHQPAPGVSPEAYLLLWFGVGSSSQGWGSCMVVHQPAPWGLPQGMFFVLVWPGFFAPGLGQL